MSVSRLILSEQDIERLIKSDNADDRAVAAHKVCRIIEGGEFSAENRAAAQDIIRIVADDTAELVRRALAVTLRTSTLLPEDVAHKLAQDVPMVAVPILSYSPIFTDAELAEIIRTGGPVRQIAVAKRSALSETVTSALSTYGVEEAVVIACANDNAQFNDDSLGRVLERFGASEIVQSALVYRQALPVFVAERLVQVVGEALKQQLIARHDIAPEVAAKLTEATQERATLEMHDPVLTRRDPAELARQLADMGRLTPSLMLRALARGQMAFFEHALAILSGVPHMRAALMVHDAGPLGFRAIYDRAGLPARLYQTFQTALEAYSQLEAEQGYLEPLQFQERLIERFLTQVPYASREDLMHLYERLDRDAQGRYWGNTATAPTARAA
ncbi:MAG: DUF2336 domain-containing protein [Asticcacaulis sp.]